MVSMLVVFALSSLAAAVVGLPVDYVWRRAPRPVAWVAGAGNAVALILLVGAAAAAGLLAGAGAVVALVLGLVAGSAGANAAADGLWGPR